MNNHKSPLISIIIPVYNVEKYVERCAKSLINQTYSNCEFIFVNDGSKDNSSAIIKEIDDKRIKIINQLNQGVSAARNTGIKAAKGKYIIFVDADDYVSSDYVEYLYNLISSENADFAYSTNIFQSKKDKQIENDIIQIVDGNKSAGILLSPDVVVGSCNKIYKKDLIDDNNLFFRTDLFYGEGLNYIIRMSLFSNKVVVGKRRVLYYRKNNFSSATTMFNIEKYKNGLKSLGIIKNIIPYSNDFVKSMFIIHISTFYLGAIIQIINQKKEKEYKNDYTLWKKELRNNLIYLLKNKNISFYRKNMILLGTFFPHILAIIDRYRRKNIMKNSV